MSEQMENRPETQSGDSKDSLANKLTLEIAFLAFIGIVVVAALIEAFSYELVSSRTPFVIMAPLLILIVIHGLRLYRVANRADSLQRVKLALKGNMPRFSKVLGISGWMVALLFVIGIFGHYVGIFTFGMWLTRVLAKERLILSLLVVGITTLTILLTFEFAFNVELYRGLLWRWYAGYRVF